VGFNPASYDTRDDNNLDITNYTKFDITVIGPGNPGIDGVGGGGGGYFSAINQNTNIIDFDMSGLQIKVIDGEISVETGEVELMATQKGTDTGGNPDNSAGKRIYTGTAASTFSLPIRKDGYAGFSNGNGGNAGNTGDSNPIAEIAAFPGYGTNPDGTQSSERETGFGYGGSSNGESNVTIPGGYYWRIIFHN
jgi:hypothetical protein